MTCGDCAGCYDCAGTACDYTCDCGCACAPQVCGSESCKGWCLEGTTCDLTCNVNNSCDLGCRGCKKATFECKTKPTKCDFRCEQGGDCEVDCLNKSTCTTFATDSNTVTTCEANTTQCEVDCKGTSTCALTCGGDCKMKCQDQAQCLVTCSGGTCDFDCPGTVTDCGNGVSVCNRACP